jgi:cytochrome c peroxidase
MALTKMLRQIALAGCCILAAACAAFAVPYPLSKIPVPEPPNLSQFVKDKAAAIKLGKALFWDMQAGSDGTQSCASCHFIGGADNRLTNQLHPGPAAAPAALPAFDLPGSGLNYVLQPGLWPNGDFPFFQVSPVDGRLGIDPFTGLPQDPNAVVQRDINDVVGSQGVSLADFVAVNAGQAQDAGTPNTAAFFGASRQVTGRNAPSVINAVFNYANFWDGRANNIFNGANPLGPLDVNAGIWSDDGVAADLVPQKIAIPNASLASQATGPPLSGVEMSFVGRSFPELGRKMLSLRPLGQQLVHPGDSVLGAPLARASLQPDGTLAGNRGLSASYDQMIKDAFPDALWNSSKTVTLAAGPGESDNRFSQMEANFSLFWGLAIQLYEATLVSDQTPFDRFVGGNTDSLSISAQNGFATFVDKCAVCHSGSELSSAVVGSKLTVCVPPDCNRAVFTNITTNSLVLQDLNPNTFAVRLADAGYFNIGVRGTTDDLGRGAGPAQGFPFPLSFARLARTGNLPFPTAHLPPGSAAITGIAVDGAFKTPGLRNVELTAPYFHNGSMNSLEQVVEFYTRGGNFPDNPELAAAMQPIRNLRGSVKKRAELVDFLTSLTDERVRNQTAPFDHPELRIPSGDAADHLITLAATGGAPTPIPPALTVNPVVTPSVLTSQTFSGTVAPLATVEVQVNGLPPVFATVTGTFWSLTVAGLPVGVDTVSFTASSASGVVESQQASFTVLPLAVISGAPFGGKTTLTSATLRIAGSAVVSYQYSLDGGSYGAETPVADALVLTGLPDGSHTVSVLGRDALGNQQPLASPTTATWAVKAIPPSLTLDPVLSPTGRTSITLSGTVDLGSIPSVVVDRAGHAGPVTTIPGVGGSRWSCTVTGLGNGTNTITVTALDFVFNSTIRTAAVEVVPADGNLKGTGVTDLSDALTALRISVGLISPSPTDLLHGDVAPLVNGVPAPNGRIDLSDALVILRKVVGLISF